MSIYTVLLSEWYPPSDEMHDFAFISVAITRCYACHKRPRWFAAVGHHSIPWGYGEIWCGWKCCRSRKVGKPDKRQARKIKRVAGRVRELWVDVLKNSA